MPRLFACVADVVGGVAVRNQMDRVLDKFLHARHGDHEHACREHAQKGRQTVSRTGRLARMHGLQGATGTELAQGRTRVRCARSEARRARRA